MSITFLKEKLENELDSDTLEAIEKDFEVLDFEFTRLFLDELLGN